MHDPLRLCLDLNIWCARFLADRKNRLGTLSQQLVAAVVTGECSLGGLQLIISWGMLNRLREVLETKLAASAEEASAFIAAVASYAHLGARDYGPSLTLGGTGLMPLSDVEDAHVIDTAIAGRADILVTANFRDFLPRHAKIMTPDRLARITHARGELLIVHPCTFRDWLSHGQILLPS